MHTADAAEVKGFIETCTALFNQGNVDDTPAYFHPEFSNFWIGGGLLIEGGLSRERIQNLYDAGMAFNLRPHHLDVKIYNNTAVVTGYSAGSVDLPGGVTLRGTWRYSAIVIKTDDGWKIAHNHYSPLTPVHEQREK